MNVLETLIGMGADEELAKKIVSEVINGSFIPKGRFNEVNEENKTLKQSIAERDTQLEDLKKASGDNAQLQQQIADLQKQNTEQAAGHAAELAKIKRDNAIDMALTAANAKNNKAVRAMLDADKIKLDDAGKLSGLDEQLAEIIKSDAYLFNIDPDPTKKFRGFIPGASQGVPNAKQAIYETRLAEARKSSNNLEIIKIKQEAAVEGVFLT